MDSKVTVIPSAVIVKLTNNKQQTFDLWFKPAKSISDIYDYVSIRDGLLTDIFITSPFPLRNALPLNFNAELLRVTPHGIVNAVINLHTNHQKLPDKYLSQEEFDQGYFYLLVRPALIKEFDIKSLGTSFVRETVDPNTHYLTSFHDLTTEFKASNQDEIIEAVLRQQKGEGLRSEFPYAYVWYHDKLYVVLKSSLPGYAASRVNGNEVIFAYLKLVEKGLSPAPVEAIYHRPFIKSVYKATARHTWYGIRNTHNYYPFSHTLKAHMETKK